MEGELVPETAAPVEYGTIQLSRVQGGYRDLLRRYTVLIDGAPAGRIGRGQTLRLDVSPGAHRLQLKIDWCSSPLLTAEVESGKSVYFTCSPGGDASEALARVTANTGSYIALSQTPDPVVMTRTPIHWGVRFQIGIGVGFFGGGLTLVGAFIWHYAAGASTADNVVLAVSTAVCVASIVGFKLNQRLRGWHRRRT